MTNWTSADLAKYERKKGAKPVKHKVVAGRLVIPCVPMGKPRMTQRDKWAKRPCVVRYYALKDIIKAHLKGHDISDVGRITFVAYLPMPKSWSKQKKAEMKGRPHRQKPDVDNLAKLILDAMLSDDSGVFDLHGTKFWDDGNGSRLVLSWRNGEI